MEDQSEAAIIVQLSLNSEDNSEELAELQDLVFSAGAKEQAVIRCKRTTPDVRYCVGRGKALEIKAAVAEHAATIVIVNHVLSPAQERNLERLVQCRVIDRTRLILDIFAIRARTFEGKLQVELAQLKHLSTRLVRGWTHLERQKGGIGLRGPGETQLETDRRLLRNRIKTITERLEKVRSQRALGRNARNKAQTPLVSLVGYTNAGKSALFNRITDSQVYTADKLFATLDPTLRRVEFTRGYPFVMADTVGFIRHLPHDLVDAFRATLEETQRANLLLHVVDSDNEERQQQIVQVENVLQEINADHIPCLQIFNKIDKADNHPPQIERDSQGKPCRVWISALTGEGMALLELAVNELLFGRFVERQITLPVEQARIRAHLYEMGAVLQEHVDDAGWSLLVRLPEADFEQLAPYL